jgi:hypothetical protein
MSLVPLYCIRSAVPKSKLVSKLRQAGSDCHSKKTGCEDHLENKFVTASSPQQDVQVDIKELLV